MITNKLPAGTVVGVIRLVKESTIDSTLIDVSKYAYKSRFRFLVQPYRVKNKKFSPMPMDVTDDFHSLVEADEWISNYVTGKMKDNFIVSKIDGNLGLKKGVVVK